MTVVHFLQQNNIDLIHNRSVGNICGNYRPDILIDCNTHFIVVEVDENQHQYYDQNCEMARMNNIYIALGLPVIFLRYNPDEVFHLYQKIDLDSQTRLAYLLKKIQEYQQLKDPQPITIERLFYDVYDHNFSQSQLIEFELNLESNSSPRRVSSGGATPPLDP